MLKLIKIFLISCIGLGALILLSSPTPGWSSPAGFTETPQANPTATPLPATSQPTATAILPTAKPTETQPPTPVPTETLYPTEPAPTATPEESGPKNKGHDSSQVPLEFPQTGLGALVDKPDLSYDDVQLLVPSLNIDQAVAQIPLQGNTWDLSVLGDGVGMLGGTGRWPGDILAIVLAGHVGLRNGGPGAFAGLNELRQADTIILRLHGQPYRFLVNSKTIVRPDEINRLFVLDGTRLLLVTCIDWDQSLHTYAHRLVIEAIWVQPED